MKSISCWLGLVVACAAMSLSGRACAAPADEPDRSGPADRIQRLEQRVNEMAQRQEQLMRQLGAQRKRQAGMPGSGPEGMRPGRFLRERARMDQPMPPAGAPVLAGMPVPQAPSPARASLHEEIAGLLRLCLLIGFVFNILLAIWIYTDIRKRGEGSPIFIVLALLAGIPATIIYSLVRIGDKKP